MSSQLYIAAELLKTQSLQIGIVFLIVLAACRLLRRASPHLKYLLWLVVIIKCVTPPIVVLPLPVLPAKAIADSPRIIARETRPVQEIIQNPKESQIDLPEIRDRQFAALPGASISAPKILPQRHRWSTWERSIVVWSVCVVTLLVVVVARMVALHRRIVRSRLVTCIEVQSQVEILSKSIGLRKPPKVYEVDFSVQPFVWGWLRGNIYLPTGFAQSVSKEKLLAVLTHELAHIARWDAGVNHLQNIVQSIFFFHPLVWYANRRMRLEREKCCDEIVLSCSSASPKLYCETIVDMLARQQASMAAIPSLAVTGAKKNIQERIVSILVPNRVFKRRLSRYALLVMLLFASFVLPSILVFTSRKGFTQGKSEINGLLEMKPFKLKLVDDSGNPVQGVLVTKAGVRTKENPEAWWSWPEEAERNVEHVTDENGEIDINYPVRYGQPGPMLTTTTLFLRYRHADFVAGEAEVDPTRNQATHELTRGCSAAFRCKGIDGASINEFAVFMAGQGGNAIWQLNEGESRSGGIPEGLWQTMLVVPRSDGNHLFSNPFDVHYEKGQDLQLDIEVQPGMRVSGSLSNNVPRPITDGKVIAYCVPKPLGERIWENPSVAWQQETVIAADGTFEFSSLPPSQSIQLIALSKGWLSDGWQNDLMHGLIINPEEDDIKGRRLAGLTLPMAAAGAIEVEVANENGIPIKGAEVSCWPFQMYSHSSGTTLLGFCYSSVDVAISQIKGTPAPTADLKSVDRYNAITDDKGKAVLRDLPLDQNLELGVWHDQLLMENDDPQKTTFSGMRFMLTSPATETMRVRMYRPQETKAEQETKMENNVVSEKPLPKSLPQTRTDYVRYDVDLLNSEEFMKILDTRMVTLDTTIRQMILDSASEAETIRPEFESTLQQLRDGKDTISIGELSKVLVYLEDNISPIWSKLASHEDLILRFAAHLSLATIGDAVSASKLHELIHDKSIALGERQILCTWSSGVGIRFSDSPEQISEHFANVTRQEAKFKPGDVAPDFEFETVKGENVKSTNLRGKIIVLHFWSTSCGPCMGQMPSHVASLSKYDPKKIEIVFVSLDDDQAKFDEAVQKYRINFKNVLDERGWGGELTRTFGVSWLPQDIIIDAEGKIASHSIEDLPKLMKSGRK